MRATRIRCIAAALFVLLTAPLSASGQQRSGGADEAKPSVARAKGEEGLKLFAAERWDEAYEKFREAEELYHAPTLVLYMARCQRRLGDLIKAAALYEKLLAEPIPPNAPKPFVEARESAKVELQTVRKRTPKLKVVVAGVPPETARVSVDGAPVAEGEAVIMNPGRHTVEVSADKAEPVVASYTLREGATETVVIPLRPLGGGGGAIPEAPREPADAGPKREGGGSVIPAVVAFGVGAAGLGLGAVAGGVSLSMVSDLKSRCQGNLCPMADQEKADTAGMLGNLSTAGFVIGGVGVAAGVVLLVLRSGSGDAKAGGGSARGGVGLTAGISLGRLEIRGRF